MVSEGMTPERARLIALGARSVAAELEAVARAAEQGGDVEGDSAIAAYALGAMLAAIGAEQADVRFAETGLAMQSAMHMRLRTSVLEKLEQSRPLVITAKGGS